MASLQKAQRVIITVNWSSRHPMNTVLVCYGAYKVRFSLAVKQNGWLSQPAPERVQRASIPPSLASRRPESCPFVHIACNFVSHLPQKRLSSSYPYRSGDRFSLANGSSDDRRNRNAMLTFYWPLLYMYTQNSFPQAPTPDWSTSDLLRSTVHWRYCNYKASDFSPFWARINDAATACND